MDAVWWGLPGPSEFIDAIADDLSRGKTVFVLLPRFAPEGLFAALRRRRYDSYDWVELEIPDAPHKPLQLIVNSLSFTSSNNGNPFDLLSLFENDTFAGRCLVLNGLTNSSWAIWKPFLEDYHQTSRNHALLDRSIFLCPFDMSHKFTTPQLSDVAFATHIWRGKLSELDILQYVSQILPDSSLTRLQRNTALWTITSLGAWDPALCQWLAAQTINDLRTLPEELLHQYASQRGWEGPQPSPSWELGHLDELEGQKCLHSALLVAEGNNEDINARIWLGQMKSIMPALEEQRRRLIARWKNQLSVPFETSYGETIHELSGLEFGHLESQLRKTVPKLVTDQIAALRKVRNALAHFSKLDKQLLEQLDSHIS